MAVITLTDTPKTYMPADKANIFRHTTTIKKAGAFFQVHMKKLNRLLTTMREPVRGSEKIRNESILDNILAHMLIPKPALRIKLR